MYTYYRVGLLFVYLSTSRQTFMWFSVLWLWYTKLYEHLSVNLCVDICLFLLGKFDKCVYMTFWRKQNSRYSQEEVTDSKWRDESEIIHTYLIIWRDMYKTIKKKKRKPQRKIGRLQQTGHLDGGYICKRCSTSFVCVCGGEGCQLKSCGDLGVMEIMPIKNGQKMWRDISLLRRYVDSK